MNRYDGILDQLKFNEAGLVPAIAQDDASGKVLMLAYMNRESLELTLSTGHAHYYSRSRKKLWKKGETSGHLQNVRRVLIDCDADTILLIVEQKGAACHKGYPTCFYREVTDGEEKFVEQKAFDPDKVYSSK